MDWNSKNPLEWDWENLAMFNGKTIEIPKQVQLSSHEIDREGVENGSLYPSAAAGFSCSDLGYRSSSKSSISASADSSLNEGLKKFSPVEDLSKDYSQKEEFSGDGNFSTLGANIDSGEPMIGLKLGKRTYFEDMCSVSTSKTTPSSVIPTSSAKTTKRSRASYHSTQTPCCQVEGCNLDLKSAKDYHRRHRICESHSKSPKVIVDGMECRFCQQCSRFHDLSEFDDKKRSCRRRLSDHNARRRRPQAEAFQYNSMRASASYDGGHQMKLLLNRVPTPVSHHSWQNASRDYFNRPETTVGINRQQYLSCDNMAKSISLLRPDTERILTFQSTPPRVLNHDLAPSAVTANLDVAPDLQRALSLLSTNSSWGLNEPERPLPEQFIQVNQNNDAQPVMHAEPQNLAVTSSQYLRVAPPPVMSRLHSLDFLSRGSSQLQEFQLFKAPYESRCFYPNETN